MRFVNPKNDIAFKKIFGSEDKSNILISFLNSVLGLTDDKEIQAVALLNPYQTPKLTSFKSTILDIKATDKRDITYIIEMQIAYVMGLKKRFTYYTTKAYTSQIERGEDYPKLNQVIFIGILDFTLFKHNEHYLSRHQILDTETQRQEFEDIEMTFIELPKFKKGEAEVENLLEKWLYFIKHAEDLEVVPDHVAEPALEAAYQVAEQFAWEAEDLEAYEYRGIRIQDQRGALEFAQAQGEVIGRQKGEVIGLQNKAIESARKMKADGVELALIAKYTGLTTAEIEQL